MFEPHRVFNRQVVEEQEVWAVPSCREYRALVCAGLLAHFHVVSALRLREALHRRLPTLVLLLYMLTKFTSGVTPTSCANSLNIAAFGSHFEQPRPSRRVRSVICISISMQGAKCGPEQTRNTTT